MRPENRLLDAIGCDGALRLHLSSAEFPIRYLVYPQALIFFCHEVRNRISNRNKTTRPNTDARLNSEEFYEPGLNRQISNRELGGVEAFNDPMGHLSQVGN